MKQTHRISAQYPGYSWAMIAEAVDKYASEHSDVMDVEDLWHFVDNISNRIGLIE